MLTSGEDTAIIIIPERRIMAVVVGIIIDIVFGIVIVADVVVVVVVIVNYEGPTLNPAIEIIIVGVDEAKSLIIRGVRGLDTAVGTVIV